MADTYTTGQDLQGQILDTVHKSQEMTLEAIRSWTAAVQPVATALPPVTLPLAGQLPQQHEMVASFYNFTEQLLASQRKFAEDLLRATAPLSAALARNAAGSSR